MLINPRDYCAKRVDRDLYEVEDLSQDQRESLIKLNEALIKLEKQIQPELNRLHILGKQRVDNHSDWVEDFEVESHITFILNEADPEFDEDLDNILVQLRKSGEDLDYLSNEQINYNEFQHWDHPMSNEYHCWLYHCLYDHTDLGWSNILRIGKIWLDVDIEFQAFITI